MNVLVDTSVWVDHLRSNEPQLTTLLTTGQVFMHTLIIGELACGNLRNRDERLRDWHALPSLPESPNRTVLDYIEERRLMGRGIGLVDAHLLYAVETAGSMSLWTKDTKLRTIAEELGFDYAKSPQAG